MGKVRFNKEVFLGFDVQILNLITASLYTILSRLRASLLEAAAADNRTIRKTKRIKINHFRGSSGRSCR